MEKEEKFFCTWDMSVGGDDVCAHRCIDRQQGSHEGAHPVQQVRHLRQE